MAVRTPRLVGWFMDRLSQSVLRQTLRDLDSNSEPRLRHGYETWAHGRSKIDAVLDRYFGPGPSRGSKDAINLVDFEGP